MLIIERVATFLRITTQTKLNHSLHQGKTSVNLDRLSSNVSASKIFRCQFGLILADIETCGKRTSLRTSTRLQSRQRRPHD